MTDDTKDWISAGMRGFGLPALLAAAVTFAFLLGDIRSDIKLLAANQASIQSLDPGDRLTTLELKLEQIIKQNERDAARLSRELARLGVRIDRVDK